MPTSAAAQVENSDRTLVLQRICEFCDSGKRWGELLPPAFFPGEFPRMRPVLRHVFCSPISKLVMGYPDMVFSGSVSAELFSALCHSLARSTSLWSKLSSCRVKSAPFAIFSLIGASDDSSSPAG